MTEFTFSSSSRNAFILEFAVQSFAVLENPLPDTNRCPWDAGTVCRSIMLVRHVPSRNDPEQAEEGNAEFSVTSNQLPVTAMQASVGGKDDYRQESFLSWIINYDCAAGRSRPQLDLGQSSWPEKFFCHWIN